MKKLHEITLSQLKEATNGHTFNVESTDTNTMSVAFYGATIEVTTEFKDGGEIVIHKPSTLCEVKIDCEDILGRIETDDNGHFVISFNNEMSELEITEVFK